MKFSLLLFLCPLWIFAYPLVPDEDLTAGDLCRDSYADFEEYRYEEEIPYCKRNVSSGTKRAIYDEYGIEEKERKDYTIDHLIPLAIGGSNSRKNLWPEHREVKALRPKLEMELYIALRDGEITQEEALEKVLEAKFHPRQPVEQEPRGRRNALNFRMPRSVRPWSSLRADP